MTDQTYELDLPVLNTDNPDPRVPVALVLDTSGSMEGEPIRQLNAGLDQFRKELADDDLARKRAEITVVTFGPRVTVAQEFVEAQFLPPLQLGAGGGTPMAEAIETALDLLEARKAQYLAEGLDYFRPWLFLVTDGSPTDRGRWAAAIARAAAVEAARGVSIFAIGVDGADMATLAQVSTTRPPLLLQGLSFGELFSWLSKSLSSVSNSVPVSTDPTGMVPLPPIDGWAAA